MIIKKIVVGDFKTNCYLLACSKTKDAVIIDPGTDSNKIIELIEENKLKPKYIVLTHGHADHIGAVSDLKEKYNVDVCIHKLDLDMIKDSSLNYSLDIFKEIIIIKPDILLKDGDILIIGNLKLNIIHTPGHTEGSIMLHCKNVLFSGDTLFKEGVGRWDLFGGSKKKLLTSINEIFPKFPFETIVYPGHGPETTIEIEIKNNNYLN